MLKFCSAHYFGGKIMQTSKEMSKEIAEFCRKSAIQYPKRSITQSGIGKAVLQGIMDALLSVAAPTDPGYTSVRSTPWQVGN
jgi:hypothetical protein